MERIYLYTVCEREGGKREEERWKQGSFLGGSAEGQKDRRG